MMRFQSQYFQLKSNTPAFLEEISFFRKLVLKLEEVDKNLLASLADFGLKVGKGYRDRYPFNFANKGLF